MELFPNQDDIRGFTLSESFLEAYQSKEVPWGPLGYVVFKRTYARRLNERDPEATGTEEWWQTCQRVIEWMFDTQKKHCVSMGLPWDNAKAQRTAKDAYDRLFHMKWTPPGRGLWMAGSPYVKTRTNAGMFNCFAGETEVLTASGFKPIKELVGTTQSLLVETGAWVEAPIRSFGVQPLMKIRLALHGKVYKDIYATADHRWFVKPSKTSSFSEVLTKDLKEGDIFQRVFGQGIANVIPSPQGIQAGLVFGDGTISAKKSRIMLCGDKNKSLARLFPHNTSHSYDYICEGGGILIDGLPMYFKNPPPLTESKSYLVGWLMGYFAADGSVGKNGSCSISSTNRDNLLLVRDVAALCGIGTSPIRECDRISNLTEEESTLYFLSLTKSQLSDEFFLLEEHRNRYIDNRSSHEPLSWKVVSIELTDRKEEVYCATVPKYENFVIQDNILTGNCSFKSTKDIATKGGYIFGWIMDALMLGIGVGLDARGAGKVTCRIPQGEPEVYTIPDSREGWVTATSKLVDSYILGRPPLVLDYSLIRPAGELIIGFGGTASGPEPLMQTHADIRTLLENRANSADPKITSVEIIDIANLIGRCVVAGNVRRSAEIALGSPDDEAFITMKDYTKYPAEVESHRWASNNTVFATVGMDYERLGTMTALNGEPGYLWLDTGRKFGRLSDPENHNDSNILGVNPCKPLYSKILTNKGYITFAQALSEPSLLVMGIDGKFKQASKPFKTGTNRTITRFTLNDGSYLYGTENHQHMTRDGKWVEMSDLEIGDELKWDSKPIYEDSSISNKEMYEEGLMAGWLIGDGWFSKRPDNPGHNVGFAFGINEFDAIPMMEEIIGVKVKPHGQKPDSCKIISSHDTRLANLLLGMGVPVNKTSLDFLYGKSKDFKLGFLKAYFTTDGSVRKNNLVELYSVKYEDLIVVQDILREFGIHSSINVHSNAKSYVGIDGKTRNNQTCFKACVYAGQYKKIGFLTKFKQDLLDAQVEKKIYRYSDYATIIEINREYSVEDVYDITVHDDTHAFYDTGVVTHNCAEILLEDSELCNIAETYPAKHDTLEDYKRTLKIAYLYAKTVTLTKTHWPETNQVMLKNRRIGVGQSGIAQAIKKHGYRNLINWCDSGYKYIRDLDGIYSDWLCIPRSKRVTTVKPSGSVSLLNGSTPGIHFPKNEFYIRRVRFSIDDPLIPVLREAGYYMENLDSGNEHTKANTMVVEFPVREKDYLKSVADSNIWEQLAIVADYQAYWADNSVSVTVEFKQAEASQIPFALSVYESKLKSVSFLPYSGEGMTGYTQLPYEPISEETYNQRQALIKVTDFSSLMTNATGVKFCDGESCTI